MYRYLNYAHHSSVHAAVFVNADSEEQAGTTAMQFLESGGAWTYKVEPYLVPGGKTDSFLVCFHLGTVRAALFVTATYPKSALEIGRKSLEAGSRWTLDKTLERLGPPELDGQ